MKLEVPRLEFGSGLRLLLLGLMLAGAVAFAVGLALDPVRAWVSYLVALVYVTGLGLGAALFLASQYVSGAGWSIALRRVPEAMTAVLLPALIGVVGLVFGFRALYAPAGGAGFDGTALALRLTGCFALWWFLSRRLVQSSRLQDADGDVAHTRRNVRDSVFLALLGVWTGCLAIVELLMSLQPRWTSTVFGVLVLAGMFVSSLAVIALFVVAFRRRGWTQVFTDAHVYDLGRLLLSFSIFWVYLWVSQHLLIWYSGLPEETSYYTQRHSGSWGVLSTLNVLLNWLVPFLLLLSRGGRGSDRCVLAAALSILVGRWLDLFIVAAPPLLRGAPRIGPLELLTLVGACALFLWLALRTLARHNLVPIRDPYLVESLPALVAEPGHTH